MTNFINFDESNHRLSWQPFSFRRYKPNNARNPSPVSPGKLNLILSTLCCRISKRGHFLARTRPDEILVLVLFSPEGVLRESHRMDIRIDSSTNAISSIVSWLTSRKRLDGNTATTCAQRILSVAHRKLHLPPCNQTAETQNKTRSREGKYFSAQKLYLDSMALLEVLRLNLKFGLRQILRVKDR